MNSISYGDGVSFARFRRPVASNLLKTKYNQQSNMNSAYNGPPSTYNNRTLGNSSNSLRRLNRDNEAGDNLHKKTNSQGNLSSQNVMQNMTYDEGQGEYKTNLDYKTDDLPKEHNTPSKHIRNGNGGSRGSQRQDSAYAQMYKHQNNNINNTISYDDKKDALPIVPHNRRPESPKIVKSYKQLRSNKDTRLYDSVDHSMSKPGN